MIASKHCAPVHNFFTKCEPLLQLSQRASYDLNKKNIKIGRNELEARGAGSDFKHVPDLTISP